MALDEKLIMTNDAYGTVEVQAPPKKKSAKFYATAAALCLGCAVAGYHAPAAVGKVLNLSSLPAPSFSTRTRFESGDNGFCLGVRGAGKGKAGTDSSLTIWTCDDDDKKDSPQFMRYEKYGNSGRLVYGPENTIDNRLYCVAVESRKSGSRFKLESCKDKDGQIFQRQDIIFDGRELRLTSLNLCMNFDRFEKDQEIISGSCSMSLSMGGWRMIGSSNPTPRPRPTRPPTRPPTRMPTPRPTPKPQQAGICNADCRNDNDCRFFGGQSPCPVCDGRKCRAAPLPPTTFCIQKWEPVCGQTGKNGRELKTFDNFCFAEQAGVMFYVDGACDDEFDCKDADVDEVSWSQSCIYANTANGKIRNAGPNNNQMGDWRKCRDKGDSDQFITKWCPWQENMMDCGGGRNKDEKQGRCLRHNKDTGMFAYTDDGQWNSESKCNDRNKPDTWTVKWCPDRRPMPRPTKQPTSSASGPCSMEHDPVCGRKGNQLKTYRNAGCAEGDEVYFYEDGTCDEVFGCGDENDEVSRSQSCIVANVGNDRKVWNAGPNNALGNQKACREREAATNGKVITKWCPYQRDFMTCSAGRAGRCLRYNKDYGVFRFDVQTQWNTESKCNDKGKPETWNVKWCPYKYALCNSNNDCGGGYPKCTRRNNGPDICWK